MKKKPPQKNEPTPEYDSQRQQNVLLEKIYSEVKTVAEGHSILSQKIDRIDIKLGEHDKRFDRVESAIIENSKDIQLLKADGTQLKTGQDRIEQKLDTVITDHEQRMQKLETVH